MEIRREQFTNTFFDEKIDCVELPLIEFLEYIARHIFENSKSGRVSRN